MATSALLVMDVQNGIVERIPDDAPALLEHVGAAIAHARSSGWPIVFVRVAFRPGGADVNPRNRAFSALAGRTDMSVDDPATRIHPAVAPAADDVVVVKKRVSAFAGSDLEVVLRSLDVTSLVLSGVSTSGVVLSTLRQAADLDFGLTVLSDACADPDPEVHRVLLEKVFPRQAAVMTTDDWIGTVR